MPLVDMRDMLNHAFHNNYAIGGFGLVSLDFLKAIITAAECCRSPVILNIPESLLGAHDFELIMPAVEHAARHAKVPIAIHFDHGKKYESIVRAINLGCNSVMIDASLEAFPINIAQTSRIAIMAHACGVVVEGALGYVGGGEGENAANHVGEGMYTSAEEAKAYVERTGVDCLAVSIGTVHGRQYSRTKLDFKRLKRIKDVLGIPLILHGGSGLAEEQYHKLIVNGVAKINCYTELSDIAAKAIRSNVKTCAGKGYLETMHGIQDSLLEQIKLYMHLWGSAGRAAEVLIQCKPWQTVEHMVIYNTEDRSIPQIDAMIAQGHDCLNAIPGVRHVFSGWAITEPTRYRLCWLVKLAHTHVIESYLTHPEYVAFTNQLSKSIKTHEKISIIFTTNQQDDISSSPKSYDILTSRKCSP
jgi:fructose-bisphosphate aldolase, class II